MSGIKGELCVSHKDLRRAATARKKNYIEQSIAHELVESFKHEGWEIARVSKKKTKIHKTKTLDVLFEDRVWMIFYKLGFTCLNKDRKCELQTLYPKQIDVIARDQENIFVVECKSSNGQDPINAREALEEFVGKRNEIQKAIEAEWGRGCGRVNIVIALSSEEKREADVNYADSNKDKNIFLWSAKEIEYIEKLISQVGNSAKYQLYSVIFANKKNKALGKTIPVIRGKIGRSTFYSFIISAKQLLKYAYIHHRDLTGIVEASTVYQRMLKSAKLKEITKFIDEAGGYFPNSIIVNFTRPLNWKKHENFEDTSVGTITLPEYYGTAWIIDGQHRLYGAAVADNDVIVPVLAFENIDPLEQANLFVEINEKQTSVPPELLWDLYSDIYRKSSDEKQHLRFQIAETAKYLEVEGPLSGFIEIPSVPRERHIKLKLTTVCSTIEKYAPWDELKHSNDEKTPENAARLINSYFSVLKSLWPEDWAKGNDGVLITNNGFGVFIMVFNDVAKHMAYNQLQYLFQSSKRMEFEDFLSKKFLTPVIEYLKADTKLQDDIRSKTGRGPQSDNAAILDLQINNFLPDFRPPRIPSEPIIQKIKESPATSIIEEKARMAEQKLREFMLLRLKQHYGADRWWKQGIPGGLKKKLDMLWHQHVSRHPHLKHIKPDEDKFEFIGLGESIEVVAYRENWDEIFSQVFIDKSNFERRIQDVAALRNPSSHARRIDEQNIVDGIDGLLWLSRCLPDPNLNPYT